MLEHNLDIYKCAEPLLKFIILVFKRVCIISRHDRSLAAAPKKNSQFVALLNQQRHEAGREGVGVEGWGRVCGRMKFVQCCWVEEREKEKEKERRMSMRRRRSERRKRRR